MIVCQNLLYGFKRVLNVSFIEKKCFRVITNNVAFITVWLFFSPHELLVMEQYYIESITFSFVFCLYLLFYYFLFFSFDVLLSSFSLFVLFVFHFSFFLSFTFPLPFWFLFHFYFVNVVKLSCCMSGFLTNRLHIKNLHLQNFSSLCCALGQGTWPPLPSGGLNMVTWCEKSCQPRSYKNSI